MSERYSRLFSLPTSLYTEGSPVIIAAGALLKDNHTDKVLVQLKFRNISQKAIKSVKIKVNAYDIAKGQLNGIDTFSYLDLSGAANEEFGQSTPIYLADATTRSFTVEILSVVYADNEVFTPHTVSVAKTAPKDILDEVQRIEAEKQEMIKQEIIKNKQCQRIMVFAFVSIACVLLSIIFFSNAISQPIGEVISRSPVRYILALIVPCLCLLTAFSGKKNPVIIRPVLIICIVLFALQIVSIIIYAEARTGVVSMELGHWAMLLEEYVNGIEFGLLFKDPARLRQPIAICGYGFFAVLPNIICITVLAINSKKSR